METATEPAIRGGKSRGGCFVLFIALIILIGLAMWFFLWGRATPPAVQPDPAIPAEGRSAA